MKRTVVLGLLRLTRSFLLFFLLALVSYYFLYPHVFRCQTIRYSGFRDIGKGVWLSPDIRPDQSHKIKFMISIAAARNQMFWGKKLGKANIIMCATDEEYEKFCHSGEGAGCSIGTPMTDSYIVLNINALTPDVISHEMCHDELFARLGWWKSTFGVPQWFHEGLALMLDHRFVAVQDSIERLKGYEAELEMLRKRGYAPVELSAISSMKGFFEGDQLYINRSYMTAGREVAEWLALAGHTSLPVLIQDIKRGMAFEDSYYRLKTIHNP